MSPQVYIKDVEKMHANNQHSFSWQDNTSSSINTSFCACQCAKALSKEYQSQLDWNLRPMIYKLSAFSLINNNEHITCVWILIAYILRMCYILNVHINFDWIHSNLKTFAIWNIFTLPTCNWMWKWCFSLAGAWVRKTHWAVMDSISIGGRGMGMH